MVGSIFGCELCCFGHLTTKYTQYENEGKSLQNRKKNMVYIMVSTAVVQ